MPIERLTVLCGLPFSGKSTYASAHAGPGVLVLSRDEIIQGLMAEPKNRARCQVRASAIERPVSTYYPDRAQNAFNDAITELYVEEIARLLRTAKESEVIVDGTHLQPASRAFVRAFPDARRTAVVFPVDPETSVARLLANKPQGFRGTVTDDMIWRMGDVFVPPLTEEGFNDIISA